MDRAGAFVGDKAVKKDRAVGWLFLAGLGCLFVMTISSIVSMIVVGYYNVELYKSLGSFGDFFGGTLNPILTFLAFIGVLITIILQKIELGLTRKEMIRSAGALENQNKAITKQNFEAAFFRMLTLHNTIVNSIDLVNQRDGSRTQGRDCFRSFYTRFTKIYRENVEKGELRHSEEKILTLSYKLFWK